ncbi:MAG TPA: hypothetical protein VHM91_25800 [Verrucomicrobiales bacterium]|nr:hypothetical protein [Verrucomicrobiales bacterium]
MWKPLSIISGLILLATGGIMFTQVQNQIRSERKQAEAAKANLDSAMKNQVESNKAKTNSDTDLADAKTELAANQQKKATALATKEQKVAEVAKATMERDGVAKELADLENKLKDLGGLARLVAELKELEAKKATLDSGIQNSKDAIAATIAHREATDKVIAQLKNRDLFQKTGTVVESFRTYVSAVNPELGFVILAHGDNSNVTKGAKFDIIRGDKLIAKIVVTHLEPTKSTAEIVTGSLAAGESILPGDRAVVNVASTPKSLAAMANRSAAKPAANSKKPGAAKPGTAPADPFASPDGATPPAEKPAAPPAEKPAEKTETTPAEKPADANMEKK